MNTKKMELKFVSNNNELYMNKKSEFNLIKISGIESSDFTYTTLNTNQDGTVITNMKVQAREIVLEGDISKRDEDISRQKLISFFNPKHEGIMYLTRNEISRKIGYVVESLKFKTSNLFEYIQFSITLKCPQPFFESVDDFGKDIAQITKQFAFPLGIVQETGKIMGYKTLSNIVNLLNDGDIETGVEIFIKATDTVKNPIINLNDQFIKTNITLNQNDVLSINTNQRKKSIKLNGANVMNKINRDSTFFALNVGNNTMSYNADEGYEKLEITVFFTKKYLGV